MPKSKVRKKTAYSAPTGAMTSSTTGGKGLRPSPSWYPIVMAALLVAGLAYIVTYYMASEKIGFMNHLGAWNFAVGFGFLVAGLGMAVRWR